MYTFSSKLRMSAIILMIVGLLGIGYGFISAPKTVEEAKAMVSDSHHDDSASLVAGGHDAHSDQGHDASHDEHLLHQLQNKPWAAFYVAAFFFMMISLGVLAFYAIQQAAQAGWSPVLFRVIDRKSVVRERVLLWV